MSSETPSRPRLLLGLLVAAALALYTSHKLYTMARIRGFIGERSIETHRVSDKQMETGVRDRLFCFLSWGDAETGGDRGGRVQVDCDYWKRARIGDSIEVVRLDRGAEAHPVGADVYASDGNFEFDLLLLAAELAGVIYYWRRHARAATVA